MKKSRYVSPKSQKKMSSRRAAAAAVVSLGAGVLGTQSAEAAVVTIDLTNVNGVNFTGQNAGLTDGNRKSTIISFGGARKLQFSVLLNYGMSGELTGPFNHGFFNDYGGIANGRAYCTPLIYNEGASVGGPVNNFNSYVGMSSIFRNTYRQVAAPTFDGYLGFLSSGDGGNPGVYGWIKATWDGTNFQFYSAAYESTPGVAIRAGDTGASAAVPEPTTMAVFGLGALVLGAGKVRKQRAARREKQAEALSV
jgi:hypothetical protein